MMDDDPIDRFLSAMPGLPRPFLDRLVDRMIDRLNEMDGDPDMEDGEHGLSAVTADGRYLGEVLPGMIGMEDDEENGDLEGIDEREPEEFTTGEFSQPEIRAFHRRRIQRDRCRPVRQWERFWTHAGMEMRPRLSRYALKKQPVPSKLIPARFRKRKRRR